MSKPVALVVGGGLKGIVAARRLIDRGYQVRLIEKGKGFGGIMSGMKWDGFTLDIGCHLFPNDEDKITDLHFDLLGGEIAPIDPNPGAYYNGRLSTGMEYPDFSTLPDDVRGAALGELLQVAAHRSEALTGPRMDVTLEKFLEIRFGKRVAALMGDAHRKILGGEARDVASPAWLAITARRAKIVDDIVAAELKSVPAFDDVILQSNAGDTMKFHRDAAGKFTARLFYPASGGMGGFISRAVARLEALGVTLSSETNVAAMDAKPGRPIGVTLTTGESLTADLIMWTTGAESLADVLGVKLHGKTINSLPMTVFYFDVPEDVPGPQTWINVFDNAVRVTRVSAPSRFAPGAAPAGRAYICAEATARMDEPLYQDPDAHAGMIWDQIKQIGFAHGPLPEHRLTRKAPVSFRHPRADYLDVRRDLDDALSRLPRIAEIEDWVFSKSECVRVCDRKLEALEHVV